MAPTPVSFTAHGGNPTTSATVTLPTTAADDILLMQAVNGGATTALTLSGTYSGGAWSSIGAGSGTSQWGGIWWSRATGNHSGQTVIAGTATDSCAAAVTRVSGCLTSASPVDTNVSSANLAANGWTLTGFNTTVADTLVCIAMMADDNVVPSAPTVNGAAMNLAGTAASTGGADTIVAFASLAQTAAGATGAFAGTHADTDSKRLVGFALKETPAAAPDTSGAYPTAVLADSPVGYWRLGELVGSVAQDASGNANHGVYTGTITKGQTGATTTDSDTSVLFDPSDSVVTVPDHSTLDVGDVFSLECWLNRNSVVGSAAGLLSKGSGGFELQDVSSGTIRFDRKDVAVLVTATSTLPSTGWHHLVATKNGSTVKLYLDAVDVTGSVTNDTIADTGTALSIGNGTSGRWYGYIDEVAIYDTELSSARVSAHYAAATSAGTPTIRMLASTGVGK
jgi:hypothetical protein